VTTGKSVRLFLVDGTPGGLLTAEIMNWTGSLAAAPRSDVDRLLNRPEARRTGIYILLGDDPESLDGQSAYIGEADVISTRLRQHAHPANGKDFWDRVVILTSKDTNLTKAHARYLESRLIELATGAQRATLSNSTAPNLPPLPESDQSDMEFFIGQAKIVLPILGVNIFRSTAPLPTDSSQIHSAARPESPVFEAKLAKVGIVAQAQQVDGEFVVRKGSLAREAWVGQHKHGYRLLWKKLSDDGVLAPINGGGLRHFTRDQVFASPSAAAAVVLGRPSNGRLEWREVDIGTTFGEWQTRNITVPNSEVSKPSNHSAMAPPLEVADTNGDHTAR